MTSRNRRITQAKDIKRRAKAPSEDGPEQCVVSGCSRPTQRSAGRGLSETYCRVHVERQARHGHPTRPSYSKAELAPFRQAAWDWYRQHKHEAHVRQAVGRLESLMSSQGRSKDHYDQRGMAPKSKARNTLARLHEAGKTGEQLFHIVLSVRAAYGALGPHGYPEFPLVVIAKQAKRLRGGGGTPYRAGPSRLGPKELRPRGLYLRTLGEMVEEAADLDPETIEEVRRRATPSPEETKEAAKVAFEAELARIYEERRTDYLLRQMGRRGSVTVGTS